MLSFNPVIYAANVSEDEAAGAEDNDMVKQVREFAATEGSDVIVICARLEEEISQLDDEEKAMFLDVL